MQLCYISLLYKSGRGHSTVKKVGVTKVVIFKFMRMFHH